MNNILKGVTAGLVATVALSLLMVMKSAMGLMPKLDVISMLSGMMGSDLAMGWIAHLMIGVIFGGLFSLVASSLPGGSLWLKGVVFAIGAWVLMMVAVMPMAGAGLFGMKLGMAAPIMTFMLHVVFGAVLGSVYAALPRQEQGLQSAHL